MTFWGVTVYRNKNSWGDGGKNLGSNTFLELVVSFSHSSGSEYCIEPERKECLLSKAMIH